METNSFHLKYEISLGFLPAKAGLICSSFSFYKYHTALHNMNVSPTATGKPNHCYRAQDASVHNSIAYTV